MEKIILGLLLLLTIQTYGQDKKYIGLPDAVEHEFVKLDTEAKGNKLWLKLKIWNKLNKILHLKIPSGQHFRSHDPGAQDLLTVEEVTISIQANQSILVDIQGFCMQHYNYGPSDKDLYYYNGFAPAPLKTLADSLMKYPALDKEYAQMFVWVLTDNKPLDFDKVFVDYTIVEGVRNIVKYISHLSGHAAVKVDVLPSSADRPKLRLFMKKGVLSFQNPVPRRVSFGLYDENDSLIHSYYVNRQLKPGIFHYAFGVNEAVEEDKAPVYYVKVIENSGAVIARMRVDDNTEMVYKEPVSCTFTVNFTLDKPLEYVKLNLYLQDGTLIQELNRYKLLESGIYDISVEFEHIFEAGTTFIAKLEDASGNLYHQQQVK